MTSRTVPARGSKKHPSVIKVREPRIPRNITANYHIDAQISKGAFGTVYRGENKETKVSVALKFLNAQTLKNDKNKRWRRESDILSKCNHTNIIRMIESVEDPDLKAVCFVFEYLPFELYRLARLNQMKIPIEHIKCMMEQILEVVSYLHDKNIIHRNLKTTNILLNEEGVLKIANFGHARECKRPVNRKRCRFGTLFYMSIESLLDYETYSSAVDIWAVGCIFAELFRGRVLFFGHTEENILDEIFLICGVPTEDDWPGVNEHLQTKEMKLPTNAENRLRGHLGDREISDEGYDLLTKLLSFNPSKRITAKDALQHEYFISSALGGDQMQLARWLKHIKPFYQH